MKNKKLLLTTALSSALAFAGAGSKVYAQTKNFSGPYISIGGNYQASDSSVSTNSTPSVTAAAEGGAASTSALLTASFIGFNDSANNIITRVAKSFANNEGEIIPTASIGYNTALDDKFMLGVEARYSDKGSDKSFSQAYTRSVATEGGSGSFSIVNTSGTESIKISDKESWTISLNPGYVVDNNLMVYGKLGYTQLKQTASVKYSLNSASNHTVSNDVEGYTLGLGARYNLDKNLFLDFGASATKFDKYSFSKSDTGNATTSLVASPNSTTHTLTTTVDNDYYYNALISIGYRF